jgi:endonuclease YncB( thermonuclease family)
MKVAAIIALLLFATATSAEPITPGAVRVIDGDTIAAGERTVRLVGPKA